MKYLVHMDVKLPADLPAAEAAGDQGQGEGLLAGAAALGEMAGNLARGG